MDGIQPYVSQGRTPVVPAPSHHAVQTKVVSDYIYALRRRIWLVFMVAVPLSVAAAIWTVRQPYVYQAKTEVFIEAPQFDTVLSTLVSHEVDRRDSGTLERYLPNTAAQLKNRALVEKVINDPSFLQGAAPSDGDMTEEFLNNLNYRIRPGSNWVSVTLDGTDPAKTAKQLFLLIETFANEMRDDSVKSTDASRSYANDSLTTLRNDLRTTDEQMYEMLKKLNTIGPGGKNIIQAKYETLGAMLIHKKMKHDEFQQQSWISKMFPKFNNTMQPEEADRLGEIKKLQETRRKLITQLREYQRVIRNFDNDPSVRHAANKLDLIERQISDLKEVQVVPQEAATDPSETILASIREEIQSLEEASKNVLGELKESMPDHQKFLALQDQREQLLKRKSDMETKLSAFDMLSKSQKLPVRIPPSVQEPLIPIRPKRALNIVMGIVFSLGLGVALVCFLEYVDHSVKVPEHLSVGLTLPLLGVVPRIRRNALTQRGGHLWTPGASDSVEADAYRSLRASLLGAADRLGSIVTLLVTSAKAGEGKSTTALNLAATCARAGERTLLMDVDLRRPSLAEVFGAGGDSKGLVDVLRGELPWQRTVVRTDLPNLDFLPTGDTTGVPIEILGTLELRQLLIGLSHHYDRVILDGPAVLGLADCRMLGRIVDSALLVVRSGAHEMRPLQRAKAMLEQSRVLIAGVVFNGLYEDLQNWSSYGPYQPYGGEAALAREPRSEQLPSPDNDSVTFSLSGTVNV